MINGMKNIAYLALGHIKRLLLSLKAICLIVATRATCRMFLMMYTRSWTGVQDLVNMHVMNQTTANIRYFLIHNRIRHCDKCLGMDRPMRKQDDGKFECDRHLVAVKA